MPSPETLREEGLTLVQQRQYAAAVERFTAAVAGYAAASNPAGQGEMLNNIGVVERLQGNLAAAADALARAEALFDAAGDLDRRGQALGNLGDVHAQRRDWPAAIGAYEAGADCLGRAGTLDARQRQSQVLRALSLLYVRRRRWLEAMLAMERSLMVAPRLGLGQRLLRALLWLARRLLAGS